MPEFSRVVNARVANQNLPHQTQEEKIRKLLLQSKTRTVDNLQKVGCSSQSQNKFFQRRFLLLYEPGDAPMGIGYLLVSGRKLEEYQRRRKQKFEMACGTKKL